MRKIKYILLLSVLFLVLLLTSLFSIAVFVSHQLAVSRNLESISTESILLTISEYNSLHKTELASNIYEIEYTGREYDVYKTEFIDLKNSVLLYVMKDDFESKVREFNQQIFDSNINKMKSKPIHYTVFNFYFFQETSIYVYHVSKEVLLLNTFYNNKLHNSFLDKVTPPPQQIV